MNTVESILNVLCEDEKAEALYYKGQVIATEELCAKVRALAHGFSQLHILPDQRVLLLLKDKPSFIYSFLALIAIGALPVPLNPKTEPATLEYILNDSRAAAVVVDPAEYNRLKDVLQKSQYIQNQNVIIDDLFATDEDPAEETKWPGLSQLLCSGSTEGVFQAYQKKSCSIAFWQYTSGTTGMPKAVQHTHETMLVHTQKFAVDTLSINKQDRVYSIPKMFFGYGLGNSLFFPLLTGASVLLDDAWPGLERILHNLKTFKPTVFFGVPSIYALLLKNAGLIDVSLFENVRVFFSAGTHLPKEINLQWQQKFGRFILDGIGSTEIGHVYITNTPDAIAPGFTGWPLAGYDTKLVDGQGEEVGDNTVGELCIRPPFYLTGYWEAPDKTNAKFRNGWYYSGDLFERNSSNGAYTCKGRKDDLFKVYNGRWVTPAEVEQKALLQFGFEECALVGVADEEGLTMPVLFVVAGQQCPEAADVIEYLKTQVENYKAPRQVVFLKEMPRNANGKVVRKRLPALVKQALPCSGEQQPLLFTGHAELEASEAVLSEV